MKILTFLLLTSSLFAYNLDGRIEKAPNSLPAFCYPAMVEVIQGEKIIQTARVNFFGYYHFSNLSKGDYRVIPFSKRAIVFIPQEQFIVVDQDTKDVDFLFDLYNRCLFSLC